MNAISLYQPWASLVILGHKEFETRSWPTNYRGPLAIAASKSEPKRECREAFADLQAMWEDLNHLSYAALPRGCVLGIVDLVDCVPTESLEETVSTKEYSMGDFGPSRFAWKLRVVEVFERPIPAKGSMGLWWWDGRP